MNQKKIIKELGLKSTLKIVDYFSYRVHEDRDFSKVSIADCVDIQEGDVISIVVLGKKDKKVVSTESTTGDC